MAPGCGIAQCHDFGVWTACSLGVALAQQRAMGRGYHATHTGVGRSQPQGLAGQIQGALHGGEMRGRRGHRVNQSGFSEFRGSDVRGSKVQRSEVRGTIYIGVREAWIAYYQFENAVLVSVDFDKVNSDNHDSGKFDSKFLQNNYPVNKAPQLSCTGYEPTFASRGSLPQRQNHSPTKIKPLQKADPFSPWEAAPAAECRRLLVPVGGRPCGRISEPSPSGRLPLRPNFGVFLFPWQA
jgi:hypothetical protein